MTIYDWKDQHNQLYLRWREMVYMAKENQWDRGFQYIAVMRQRDYVIAEAIFNVRARQQA